MLGEKILVHPDDWPAGSKRDPEGISTSTGSKTEGGGLFQDRGEAGCSKNMQCQYWVINPNKNKDY